MGYLQHKLLKAIDVRPITHFHLFLIYCVEEQHYFFAAMCICHKNTYKTHSELAVATKCKLMYCRKIDLYLVQMH